MKSILGKDQGYFDLFTCHDNIEDGLHSVINTVRLDVDIHWADLVDKLQNESIDLNRKLSERLQSDGKAWHSMGDHDSKISMGENVGYVRGPHDAVKAVEKLITDGEEQRRTIRRLEIKIERYVVQLFHKPPVNPPREIGVGKIRIYAGERPPSADSELLATVTMGGPFPPAPRWRWHTLVNAVKRFHLFGGKP